MGYVHLVEEYARQRENLAQLRQEQSTIQLIYNTISREFMKFIEEHGEDKAKQIILEFYILAFTHKLDDEMWRQKFIDWGLIKPTTKYVLNYSYMYKSREDENFTYQVRFRNGRGEDIISLTFKDEHIKLLFQ